MQKKLLAVAVAGALFTPLAMAQSSVTISGVFKVGIDNYKISNVNAARPAGVNRSETRITDNSSRMIFGITEDLGGGLSAIAQLDARPQLDDAGGGFAESGNSWVGVRSSTLGTLTFGRHDLHYGKQPDDTAAKAGALMATAVSIMDYTWLTGAITAAGAAGTAVAPAAAIASATRTPNVIRWDSPNWSGFRLTAAYSTSPFGNESDLQTGGRKGNAWTFNPSYTSGPFQIGASMWKAKGDGGAGAALVALDQDSLSIYGYYRLGAFKIGAAMNDSEVELHGANALLGVGAAGTATKVVDRRNWTIPVSFTSGPHTVAGHYTRAGKDKAAEALGVGQTQAKMFAVVYNYDLSKRTAIGVTYANLNNETNAAYNFFTNTGGLGSTMSSALFGEDQKLMAFTVRHAF